MSVGVNRGSYMLQDIHVTNEPLIFLLPCFLLFCLLWGLFGVRRALKSKTVKTRVSRVKGGSLRTRVDFSASNGKRMYMWTREGCSRNKASRGNSGVIIHVSTVRVKIIIILIKAMAETRDDEARKVRANKRLIG